MNDTLIIIPTPPPEPLRREIVQDGITYREVRPGDDAPSLPKWQRILLVFLILGVMAGAFVWLQFHTRYPDLAMSIIGAVLAGFGIIIVMMSIVAIICFIKD